MASFVGDFYRRVRALVSERPSRFSWLDDDIAGSGKPMSLEQLRWVKERGVTMIVSLTETPLPQEWVRDLGLRYLHEPVRDHSAPSPEKLQRIVDAMLEEIRRGGKVLVHCAGGVGRTGTVLAAYLIAKKGLKPEDAVNLVRQRRPGSIEPAQEWSVYEFYRRYRG